LKCKICNSESKEIHKARILNKYNIQYFQCTYCGFVQTEEPFWLEESYSNVISLSDTGIMVRNILYSEISTTILSMFVNNKKSFLDYGGGYGIFTRLMRDNGFDYYWYDKYAPNLIARGFEGEIENKKYEAITSFENFEHFEYPLQEIEKIFCLTNFVLFSTQLISIPAPSPYKWWYYCLEHGQHISIFTRRSLEFIAKKYNYFMISNLNDLHIFIKQK